MAIQTLLARELSQAGRLGHVAVVALDDMEFQIQPAQTNKADDVIEADRTAAGFPARDSGLQKAGPAG
ncbi:hypothetical protein MHPYR_680011 [uncultured Mycobacterium sp.]|uniref:Uncharacterized protein n=1 Tax=uncultured Mycobacterium sp. TaxID=171292 RepID=A0A1Y5PK15_9MYCO|nr:hypothetical protein MHPYR_680011 [uncultured Mycobacterium sp.]